MEGTEINRKFIMSCKYFGGFTIDVDVNAFDNKQEIIDHVLILLKEILMQDSLESLLCILNEEWKNYHINEYEFGDFFIENKPFYICSQQLSVGAIPLQHMNTDNINEQENQNEDNSFLSMYNYFTNNYHELDNLDNYDDITNEKSN